MSFKHENYTLEKIAEYTALVKTRQATIEEGSGGVFVDGLWLTEQCAQIVGELRKKMPDLKIGANKDTRRWDDRLQDVVLYREGDAYALGRIGYGDVAINGLDYKYYVLSRNLRKARGGWGRWQNYIKSSVTMNTVLSVAKKALVPYTIGEVAALTVDQFTQTVRVERNMARTGLSSAWRNIVGEANGDELKEELIAMVRSGYKFVNHRITQRIEDFIAATETKQAADNKQLNAYFVHINPETTDIVEYENMGDTSKPKAATTINTQDLPFDLQMKIASLQVAAPMHYVEDLGMRVGDTTFWVQR